MDINFQTTIDLYLHILRVQSHNGDESSQVKKWIPCKSIEKKHFILSIFLILFPMAAFLKVLLQLN